MTAVLLAPHNDDETLFACWQILRHRPKVIVCLRSWNQATVDPTVTWAVRETETAAAMSLLGVKYEQWSHPDTDVDEDHLRDNIAALTPHYDTVIAPAVEEAGNPHHSLIGQLALKAFGTSRTISYTTYTGFPGVKTRTKNRVPYEQEWLLLKLRALACYESQVRIKSGAFRFFSNDLEEYLAP